MRATRVWLLAALLALVVSVPALGACGSSTPSADVQFISPDEFSVADYAGRPLVVNYFGSWCGPCNAEAPDLAAFSKAQSGKAAFVGVAVNDQQNDVVDFMSKYGLTYPVVLDDDSLSAEGRHQRGADDDLLRRQRAARWTASSARRALTSSTRASPRPSEPGRPHRPGRGAERAGGDHVQAMIAAQITTLSLSGVGLAFLAGLLSFVSPCVLPLLPVYLSFISGVGVDRLGSERRRLLWTSLLFVAGFTLVFVAMGAGAGGVGRLLIRYRHELTVAAGAFIAVSGLVVAGVIRLPSAGHEDDAPARRRRRRLSHRGRPRRRLDAVRRLRPRRHPEHGGLESERRVRRAAAARVLGRPRACPSCSPPWPSTG